MLRNVCTRTFPASPSPLPVQSTFQINYRTRKVESVIIVCPSDLLLWSSQVATNLAEHGHSFEKGWIVFTMCSSVLFLLRHIPLPRPTKTTTINQSMLPINNKQNQINWIYWFPRDLIADLRRQCANSVAHKSPWILPIIPDGVGRTDRVSLSPIPPLRIIFTM